MDREEKANAEEQSVGGQDSAGPTSLWEAQLEVVSMRLLI
jgi:hypothetical protein